MKIKAMYVIGSLAFLFIITCALFGQTTGVLGDLFNLAIVVVLFVVIDILFRKDEE